MKTFLFGLALLTAIPVSQAAEPSLPLVHADIKIISVTKGSAGTDKLFTDSDNKPTNSVVVSKATVEKWFEAAKSQPTTTVISKPQLMLENDQDGLFQVGQSVFLNTGLEVKVVDGVEKLNFKTESVTLGLKIGLKCTLDADSDKTKLKFVYENRSLANPRSLSPVVVTMAVQEGGPKVPVTYMLQDSRVNTQKADVTQQLLFGQTLAVRIAGHDETRVMENKLPVLGDMPYVNRLFRNRVISTEAMETVALISITKVKTDERDNVSVNKK